MVAPWASCCIRDVKEAQNFDAVVPSQQIVELSNAYPLASTEVRGET